VSNLSIRDVAPDECAALGQLLVEVYAALEGFPGREEQPGYYAMLADIGRFTRLPGARVLVAIGDDGELLGGVVYFGDMAQYGAGGEACRVPDAAGMRLLGVAPAARGRGVGKALTQACLAIAREQGHRQMILHSTRAMQVAWDMYLRLGFGRDAELDFSWEGLAVYGFSRGVGIAP